MKNSRKIALLQIFKKIFSLLFPEVSRYNGILRDIISLLNPLVCEEQEGKYINPLKKIERRLIALKTLFSLPNVFILDFDRISEKNHFDIFQTVYNKFKFFEATSFLPIFRQRIEKNSATILTFPYLQNGKEIVVITDSDFAGDKYKCIGIEEIDSIDNKENYLFVLAFNNDWLGREAIKKLRLYGLRYQVLLLSNPTTRYFNTDQYAFLTLEEESRSDFYFAVTDFENIFQALNTTKDLPGDYVEIGVYKGDSASAALHYMQKAGIRRNSYFLDTYEGFTYDDVKKSEDLLWADTHQDTSIEEVKKRLGKYSGFQCIKCNIMENDLPQEIKGIVVCNIDVDMYEAVKAALYAVKGNVIQNGIIIVEDYGHTPALIGSQKAVHEFLDENPSQFNSLYMTSGQMILIKR